MQTSNLSDLHERILRNGEHFQNFEEEHLNEFKNI